MMSWFQLGINSIHNSSMVSTYAQPELYVCKGSEEHGGIQNLPSYEVLTISLC